MAKSTTTTTGVDKLEILQSKASAALDKATENFTTALEKLQSSNATEIKKQKDEIETLKLEFLHEQQRMVEERKLHTETILRKEEDNKAKTEEMVAVANANVKNITEAGKQSIAKLNDELEYKKLQTQRLLDESILANKEKYLAELLEEQGLARISKEDLAVKEEQSAKLAKEVDSKVHAAVNLALKDNNNEHEKEIMKLVGAHATEIAAVQPTLDALKMQCESKDKTIAQLEKMIADNLAAEVDKSKNNAIVQHFDTSGKR